MPDGKQDQDLLLSFYGDDLTGSTDVMEALSQHGVPTVLFLRVPSAGQLRRCGPARAIGIAGTSRSETPAWMEQHLAPAFVWLRTLQAPICHYKVCSTFDSSPEIGSIGRATEIGARIFGQTMVPLVVGAPQIRRYTAFGHLFAAYRGETYRIDRHPVMSRHPVTPMREADLRLHLGRQTAMRVGLVDLAILSGPAIPNRVDAAAAVGETILLFDVADAATQSAVGAHIWRLRVPGGLFVIGSSGIEYALVRAWADAGLLGGAATFAPPGAADRIAVVSGSCSATTERQIRHAVALGFEDCPQDPLALIGERGAQACAAAIGRGLDALRAGRSPILYTALGPTSDRGAEFASDPGARHAIGRALGRILKALVADQGLSRAVIAGGDTSSHALRELEIFALKTRLPLPQTPGSPLCTAFSDDPCFDGLEIALKGGQIGDDDYFSRIRQGKA